MATESTFITTTVFKRGNRGNKIIFAARQIWCAVVAQWRAMAIVFYSG